MMGIEQNQRKKQTKANLASESIPGRNQEKISEWSKSSDFKSTEKKIESL